MASRAKNRNNARHSPVTLKTVAEYVGFTPGTISAVLNNTPAGRSFPQSTQSRILAAARKLNYLPNLVARSLRVKRTYTIGVITEEIGDPYGAMVIGGIERHLGQRGYLFLTVAHRHDAKLLDTYANLLVQRGVEGLITVDTSIQQFLPLPIVAVAGHRRVKGVTNLVLDHHAAALMALKHLQELGHTEIAFMHGPTTSSDTEDRWQAIVEVSRKLSIDVRPELTVRLKGEVGTPHAGYPFAKRLLARRKRFTALFAYNDNSAIGAIRAFQEAGLRVPEDISVVGFDDIESAAYGNPSVTTVRQPLHKMGELAARTLLERIEKRRAFLPEITAEPEFVIRQSTARVPADVSQAREVLVSALSAD
ncbi:MAG: LacI family DNA-binding transcriptional regulator [Candidatus Acidiferrales bacterium]